MTTDDASSATDGRARVVTKLPGRGSVLVRTAAPPELSTDRCVDVRPGPFAAFDGDRPRLSLVVRAGEERRRFDRSELPAAEEAVTAFLRDRPTDDVGRNGPAVVRFGDRAACRRVLPAAACSAIERRLAAAAGRGSATLLAWTTATPRPADHRTYDAVFESPRARPE